MASPTVTVVVPTYRRPELLRHAVESALDQTYPHLRVLVSDNASGDATREVVDELRRRDPRVEYHCHPTNIGAVDNYRFAMDAVETERFVLLADDDLLLPRFLEHATAALDAHPDAGFFCGQTVQFDETRGTHGLRPHARWRDGYHEAGRWAALMSDLFFIWCASVFSTKVRDALGPIDADSVTDVIYMIEAAAQFPFVVTLVPCAIFRITGDNYLCGMGASDVRESHRVVVERCRALPHVTEDERRRILANVERHFEIVANGLLRTALEAADARSIEETAAFLDERGGLTPKRRMRVGLARGSAPTRWLVSRLTRLTSAYKRMRRSGWRKMTLEEVVQRYSGQSDEATKR